MFTILYPWYFQRMWLSNSQISKPSSTRAVNKPKRLSSTAQTSVMVCGVAFNRELTAHIHIKVIRTIIDFYCSSVLFGTQFIGVAQTVYSITRSFRNNSNMLIWCSRYISYCYQSWKWLGCLIYLWNKWYVFFQDSLMNRTFKSAVFISNL